jgi:pimeloyl-ACP methyl ester carboxylesterase
MGSPAVVLIHGTWRGAWCWSAVRERLAQRGIASIAPTLKGIGERFSEASVDVGVNDHIADVIDAVEASGTSCILVGHSYGSIPMWGAAAAISDRIAAVIDLDGFLPRHGQCAFEMLPSIRPIFEGLRLPDHPWLVGPIDAGTMGITDPDQAEEANAKLTPTPLRTHTDVLELRGPVWTGPRFYIQAADNGRLFDKTARLAADEGWTVWRLPGGHDLQSANPDGVVDVIVNVVDRHSEPSVEEGASTDDVAR